MDDRRVEDYLIRSFRTGFNPTGKHRAGASFHEEVECKNASTDRGLIPLFVVVFAEDSKCLMQGSLFPTSFRSECRERALLSAESQEKSVTFVTMFLREINVSHSPTSHFAVRCIHKQAQRETHLINIDGEVVRFLKN